MAAGNCRSLREWRRITPRTTSTATAAARSAAVGPRPERAATDPEAAGGDYYGPDGFFQMRGHPKRVDMVKQARKAGDAARLWEISEKLTGVHYDLPKACR
jgi:hypothetical protein